MIKLLDDLLIAATCNPNVPGTIVAGLREVADIARRSDGNPAGTPGAKVDLSRLDASPWPQEAEPATVRVARADLPPPFDSMEEAQRAAGIVPARLYRVCIRTTPQGHQVGAVAEDFPGSPLADPHHWVWCDKEGCVPPWVDKPVGLQVQETHFGWRPVPQLSIGHADAIQKPSALDEMAAAAASWNAKPVAWSDDAGKIQGRVSDEQLDALCRQSLADLEARNEREESRQAQEDAYSELCKPTNPKDAAATGRVPLGLLSPIAKAHWALAQHCGRAKYGAWNWREAGARASIYLDAIGRHADGYLSGETYDPADLTHHLGNIMACCAILLEAEAAGKLVDDRPPRVDHRQTYATVEAQMKVLSQKYADRNPRHWVITDGIAS
jgi:hypothetical protein